MHLRVKAISMITVLTFALIGGFVLYLDNYLKKQITDQTVSDLRVMAEVSEGSYFAFTENEKIRTVDWSSDGYIRNTTEALLDAQKLENLEEKDKLAKELGTYLREKKLVYDPKVKIMDILNKDGTVIASSREDRIGIDEAKEEKESYANKFGKAIQAEFGQSFISPVVVEDDESGEPMTHVVDRIFSMKRDQAGKLAPLDAVVLLHFTDANKINDMLSGQWALDQGAISGQALFQKYKTAEIYLVNKQKLMASNSRFVKNSILKQKVDTMPVKKCFEEKKETTGEYLNYAGQSVLGASMCLSRDDLTLVMEISADEIFAPLKTLRNRLFAAGILVFLLIIAGFMALSSFLLRGLYKISSVAEKVGRGDLDVRAEIKSKDEIGQLAAVFNKMLDSIQRTNADLFAAEIKLREERDRLNAVISSIGEGLLVISKDFKVMLTNRTAEKLLEISFDKIKVVSAKAAEVLRGDSPLPFEERPVVQAIRSGKTVAIELKDNYYYLLPSGKKFPVAIVATPLKYGETIIGAVLVFRDISEIKQLDEAKSNFISIASHQLRTPLTAIKLFIEMLETGRAGRLSVKQKEYIGNVRESNERMIRLVNDLLNISRIESGRLQVEPIPAQIEEVIKSVIVEAEPLAKKRGLRIVFKNDKKTLPKITVDPKLLYEVVHNLLTNAIKYGSLSISVVKKHKKRQES